MQPDATSDEIRQAYRRMALDAHPDRRGDGAPTEVMAAINEAWSVLADPNRRAEYDRTLTHPAARTAPHPPMAHTAPTTEAEPHETEVGWVDLTPQMRRFRHLLTMTIVLGAIFVLLVFWLIIWPETG